MIRQLKRGSNTVLNVFWIRDAHRIVLDCMCVCVIVSPWVIYVGNSWILYQTEDCKWLIDWNKRMAKP